jgi:hypothetical protein
VSVGVKVVLLVEGDTMGEYLHPYTEFLGSTHACALWFYGLVNEEVDFHTTKIRRAFRRSVPFFENFWKPMSVNARVVLLVKDDTTLYIPIEFGNSWGLQEY